MAVKPAASIAARNAVSDAGTSGSAATTSIPSPGQRIGDRDQPRGQGRRVRAHRDRPARQVGAAARDERPIPGQREGPAAVSRHEEPRRPAGCGPVLGPGARLVDMPARRINGSGVPVRELLGRGVPDVQSAAP